MHERPPSEPSPSGSASAANPSAKRRFGVFELDLEQEQLTRSGRPVQLQPQPWKLLVLLVEHPGALLTREDIQQHLWGDRIVDAEKGLNFAVRQIRRALGDDASNPVYIETVPRRGYRFVAPVETVSDGTRSAEPSRAEPVPTAEPLRAEVPQEADNKHPPRGPAKRRPLAVAWILLAALFVAGVLYLLGRRDTPPTTAEPNPPRLAVLPLETSGDDPADELVALGLTEELLTELGSLDSRHLALLSLSASQPLADNPQPVQELQRLLEADWVLSGSIRRSQSQTVLQLRLEGTADRRLLWTERFVETDGAMASAQRDLGIRAVRSLAEALEIPYQADARPAENPEARQAYLQGTYLLIKGGPDDALRSVPFFQRAVEIDPTNARAHAGLAEALLVSGGLPDDPAGDPQLQARNAALLALELNPSLAGPHLALAWLAAAEDWDLEEARRHVDRALELDPNFSEALHVKACFDLLAGDIEAGLQRAERAAALHPAAPSAQADLAWNYFYARRFEQALVAARTTLELESRNIAGFRVQMHSLLQLGRAQEALAHGKLLMQRRGADEEILGRMEELPPEEALEIFWQWWWQGNLRLQQQGYITREGLVEAALQLGRREEALTLLETSAEAREPYVLFLPVDARFDPLRAEARFEALLERIVRGG